jgi:peptidyl-prolyl cis-trans isomerase SurA
MNIKNFKVFFIIIFFVFISNSDSFENKILFKIEDQIITSLDVINEYKYLVALNPNLKKADEKDIIKLSRKSILKEKIKNIEIKRNLENPKVPEKFLEQILMNIYTKIGLSNLNDFKKYLIINEVDFENVKKKLEIEALWNELIIFKFSSKVKIDEKKLKDEIIKNNSFLKSYLMSEISFEVSNIKNLENKFLEISNVINNKGFDFAALQYSSSPSSNLGGKLDWINENSLNDTIKEAIIDLKINDFTKPIAVPGGFLILQINDMKNIKIDIDIDSELEKLINFEKNNQLSQYSKIYFNKVKKDLKISEL